jgi:hypothetical protein
MQATGDTDTDDEWQPPESIGRHARPQEQAPPQARASR